MSRGWIASFIVLSLIAFDSVARGEAGINTLRGIDRIKVVVEDLTSDSTNDGVTEGGLQTQTETALKQVGINVGINSVDSDSKMADSSFVPVLYVSLSTDRADGFHTFLIRLEFLQAVTLARDPTIKASSATTWSTVRFGRVDEHGYAAKVTTILRIMLQNFQDDFLAMKSAVPLPRDQPRIQAPSVSQ